MGQAILPAPIAEELIISNHWMIWLKPRYSLPKSNDLVALPIFKARKKLNFRIDIELLNRIGV